jgi:hypothetical protein
MLAVKQLEELFAKLAATDDGNLRFKQFVQQGYPIPYF